MNIVIDTNIIFSALLRFPNRFATELLLEDKKYYVPHFAFVERFKHKEKIVKNSSLDETTVLEVLYRILKNVRFVSEDHISTASWRKAFHLCSQVDEKDTPFVALAIELNGELWTFDLKLITALEKAGFKQFYKLPT